MLAAATLAFWLISGPVAMAFDDCPMTGDVCETLCCTPSCITEPVTDSGPSQPVTFLSIPPAPHPRLVSVAPQTPPPKVPLLSA